MKPREERYRECYERIAKDDLENAFEFFRAKRWRLTADFLPDLNNKRVLDLGCGFGGFAGVVKKRWPNINYIGVDIASANIREARRRGIIAFQHDIESPIISAPFDVVICSDVLEHVLHPGHVLTNAFCLLKRGGALYIFSPLDEDLAQYEKFKHTYEFTHLRSFSQENLNALLRLNGFVVEWMRPFYSNCHAWRLFVPEEITKHFFPPVYIAVKAVKP